MEFDFDAWVAESQDSALKDEVVDAARTLRRAVRLAGDSRTRDILAAAYEDIRQLRISLGV